VIFNGISGDTIRNLSGEIPVMSQKFDADSDERPVWKWRKKKSLT
jgi:hypothetical protein